VLAEGENLVPIPGTKRRTYLEQSAAALDVELTDEDLARIDTEMPEAAGARYDELSMATVYVVRDLPRARAVRVGYWIR
jgi:diketogulonate reductase-like aldo/keto reductase